VTVAESALQADTQSVCIICTTVDNISTDRKRRAGLSAIAEPLVSINIRLQLTTICGSVQQQDRRDRSETMCPDRPAINMMGDVGG